MTDCSLIRIDLRYCDSFFSPLHAAVILQIICLSVELISIILIDCSLGVLCN